MSAKTIFNIAKGIGKNLISEAANLSTIAVGAGRVGYEGGKVLGKVGSKMFTHLPAGDKGTSLIQKIIPYKMKTGAALGVTAALGLYAVGDEGAKTRSRGMLGEISSGEMANTIGISRSPNLNGKIDQVEADPNARAKFEQEDLKGGTYGAEGDIVFALHNLRNG